MIRFILFFLFTILFIWFSRRALSKFNTHGFYRFFVFEGVLLLVLLNHPHWFTNPFSPRQLVAWSLLGTSLFMIWQSLLLFKRFGGRSERPSMPENHQFENTTRIVEEGLYRYIRHPMYASLLFLGWGAFCKHINGLNIILVTLVSLFILLAAKVEEIENIGFFGADYISYSKRTKMFIPFIL